MRCKVEHAGPVRNFFGFGEAVILQQDEDGPRTGRISHHLDVFFRDVREHSYYESIGFINIAAESPGQQDLGRAFHPVFPAEGLDGSVVDDGIHFSSRVLRRNFNGVGRVFPFVLTLGRALEDAIEATQDMLEKYLLDEIGNMALRLARGRFEKHLQSTFALEKISCMAPGSLEDWPIEQQKPLFELLSGVEAAIGVSLTSRYLMLPRKSISGVYFPSDVSFFSCQLCPRERCDYRKARYDKETAREYGVLRD